MGSEDPHLRLWALVCGRWPSAPAAKPSRQLGWLGRQPNSAFAFAFDAPRDSVIMATAAGLATTLAIHAGTLRGGLAPSVSARYGSHSLTGAGSSSTML